jgi:hypothetical protein
MAQRCISANSIAKFVGSTERVRRIAERLGMRFDCAEFVTANGSQHRLYSVPEARRILSEHYRELGAKALRDAERPKQMKAPPSLTRRKPAEVGPGVRVSRKAR